MVCRGRPPGRPDPNSHRIPCKMCYCEVRRGGRLCPPADCRTAPLAKNPVIARAQRARGNPSPVPMAPLPKGGCRRSRLGDSSPHELAVNKSPYTPHESLHQPAAGPPPFRQGRHTACASPAATSPSPPPMTALTPAAPRPLTETSPASPLTAAPSPS